MKSENGMVETMRTIFLKWVKFRKKNILVKSAKPKKYQKFWVACKRMHYAQKIVNFNESRIMRHFYSSFLEKFHSCICLRSIERHFMKIRNLHECCRLNWLWNTVIDRKRLKAAHEVWTDLDNICIPHLSVIGQMQQPVVSCVLDDVDINNEIQEKWNHLKVTLKTTLENLI